MEFEVIVCESALADLDDAFSYVEHHAPRTTAEWLDRFQTAIEALSGSASIHPAADEARKCKRPLRQALYGKPPYVFRIIFFIDSDTVHVLRAVRAQQRALTKRQIDDALKTRPKSNPRGGD
jgi:plasmid stabilization system protein ParE